MTTSANQKAGTARSSSSRRVRGRNRLRIVGTILAVVLSCTVLLLAGLNLFPTGGNPIAIVAASAWSWAGTYLVVVSVIALALAVFSRRGSFLRPTRIVVTAVTLAAVVSSVSIVSRIATDTPGIDLARTFDISSPDPTPDYTAVYASPEGEDQNALVFEPRSGAEGAPVLVHIHGGAWKIGSAEASGWLARSYADRGFFVVTLDYRLLTPTDPTWDKAPADVACGLTRTMTQARDAGADVDRLTVMGESAGGHLAMLLGWSAAASRSPSSCPALGPVPVPDAVVASYPVANIVATYRDGAPFFGMAPQEFIEEFLGGTPGDVPDRVAAVSPLTYASDTTPPTLIVQPELDDFIPANGNYDVAAQADAQGVDITVDRVPFAHHAFDTLPHSLGGQASSISIMNWLDTRGLAPTR